MIPVGQLQTALDALFAGLQYVLVDTQVAGAQINAALFNVGAQLFGALGAIPTLP